MTEFKAVLSIPVAFEAEQRLLGALMIKNQLSEKIGWLRPEHFAEPLHAAIYAKALSLIVEGRLANPLTLRSAVSQEPQWSELGGDTYMAALIGVAALPALAIDYGRQIVEAFARRQQITIGQTMVTRANRGDSPDEIISEATAGFDELGKLIDQDGLRGVEDYRTEMRDLYEGRRKVPFSTGLSNIDQYYRIRPGELSIVTGYPSAGKSEVVDAIMVNLAMREGHKFAVCSFENSPDEHIAKLCEKYLGVPFYPGRTMRMSEGDLESALDWVNEHFYFIRAERDSPTITWALGRARAAVDQFKINGLVLDPYNEFEHKRPNGMSEHEYISQSLAAVKRFATRHGVHVWFVAHPAKPHPDRRQEAPTLYDIAGAAHWANKADCGISIHRPRLPSGERSLEVEIHVLKIRFRSVGKPGVAHVRYNPSTCRYENIDTHGEQSVMPDWHDRD